MDELAIEVKAKACMKAKCQVSTWLFGYIYMSNKHILCYYYLVSYQRPSSNSQVHPTERMVRVN